MMIATKNAAGVETSGTHYRNFLLQRADILHKAANLALDNHEVEMATHLLVVECELREEANDIESQG